MVGFPSLVQVKRLAKVFDAVCLWLPTKICDHPCMYILKPFTYSDGRVPFLTDALENVPVDRTGGPSVRRGEDSSESGVVCVFLISYMIESRWHRPQEVIYIYIYILKDILRSVPSTLKPL